MDILNFIQEKVSACTYKQLETLAAETGVPYGTLMKIKAGQTANPRIKTIQPLYDHFRKSDGLHVDHQEAA
ncbi:MAG: hypothetical protein PHZ14_11000 [Sulfuricella sp.]|jgi:predicted transcriptional regulator|nr:hypothetical protein [Sulfuricella sp.]